MQKKRKDAITNNSLHVARKYARIFVRGFYFFREANDFPRAKFEGNCERQGTDNVQEKLSEQIFKVKWRLLRSLSFNYFSQHAGFFENWGIPLDIPQSGGTFSHVTRLDQ